MTCDIAIVGVRGEYPDADGNPTQAVVYVSGCKYGVTVTLKDALHNCVLCKVLLLLDELMLS